MPQLPNNDALELREVKNAFVEEFVRPNSGISAVSCRVEQGRAQLVVSVTDGASVKPPDAFGGVAVRIDRGQPGRVAIGSRYTSV